MTRDRYEPLLEQEPDRGYEEQLQMWKELSGPSSDDTDPDDPGII